LDCSIIIISSIIIYLSIIDYTDLIVSISSTVSVNIESSNRNLNNYVDSRYKSISNTIYDIVLNQI